MTDQHAQEVNGDFVSFEQRGRVAVVTLERPEALNAISGALAQELAATTARIAANRDIWVVVLAAAGERAFCVGADLKERASFSLDDWHANRVAMRAMFAALRGLQQPSVASVFGFALGGGFELALSCDLIVAADDVELGLPEAGVGLVPAGGATQLLARALGTSRAKEIIFTGRRIGAEEALAAGLVAKVVPRSELRAQTLALADAICRASPVALRAAKGAIDAALGLPLEQGIEAENDAWRATVSSADRVEGIAAFNAKRDPRWSNR